MGKAFKESKETAFCSSHYIIEEAPTFSHPPKLVGRKREAVKDASSTLPVSE
jgi:hypothetical protein